ncbi:MAG: hypothetical protein JNL58_18105 [Planctomyces sp.]|nr:hypothetical protein [Planctomyces sp.]
MPQDRSIAGRWSIAEGCLVTIGLMTILMMCSATADAGMPSLMPSSWTAKTDVDGASRTLTSTALAIQLQVISFFVMTFLVSGWIVQRLWNALAPKCFRLPSITFRESLSMLVLWGLAFSVVLTMISGARELMTPGAWKKQGWTYTLNYSGAGDSSEKSRLKREQLEELRTALWRYAATHQGELPSLADARISPELWQIPTSAGLEFLAIGGCKAEEAGRLFVYEPDTDGDERLVLLTNGVIGTMDSSEIEQALSKLESASGADESNTGEGR